MLEYKKILKMTYDNVEYIRNYSHTIKSSNSIIVFFQSGKIEITYYEKDIIKIFIGESYEKSANVCAINENIRIQSVDFIESKDNIIINGINIDTYIDKSTLKISFKTKENNSICEDFEVAGKRGNNIFVSKATDCIAYYGFGEKTGSLNKKGVYMENFNTDDGSYNDDTHLLYKTIPFFIGLKQTNCYGLYFDNSFRSYFDMGHTFKDKIIFGAEGGSLQYYFIPGNSIKDVVKNYSYLTGTMPMPPMWSLGYQQCRYSYASQAEVKTLSDTFLEKSIPCDVIYLDIDYMDKYKVMTFDKDTFPDPVQMLKDLKEKGFKVVTILDPGVKVEEGYSVFQNGLKGNHFVKTKDGELYKGEVWPGLSAFPDFSNEKARKWWQAELKEFLKLGVSGIWNDMNEPAVFDNDYKTVPEECIHNGDKGYMEHKEFHNLYGMEMSRCSYEAQLDLYPNLRPFSMTRATFSGGQKYSSVWTGDNQSTWEHLRSSISTNCNLGLSGFSFIGNDVGGFGGDTEEELFIRWMELGTFLPIFRNHSAIYTRRQEPWTFSKTCEDICRKFINLRYSLLPYIYTQYYISHREGLPIFRPMVLEFEDDINTIDMYSQFMFGDSLLIAPVLYKGAKEKLVYLPKGNWYDFFTCEKYEGNKYYNISLPLDSIGVFAKEGAIIPTYENEETLLNTERLPLNIHLKAFGDKGEAILYHDDGNTNNYLKNEFNLYKLRFSRNTSKEFNIDLIHNGYDQILKFDISYK